MSLTGDFVGLDPDGARDIARRAASAAETTAHIASEVATTLAMAQIADNGVAPLCAEIDEELGLLHDLLELKAEQMELASIGIFIDTGASAAALWASLLDDVGTGVDLGADVSDDDATVPMSSSVAAEALAEWLVLIGDDDGVRMYDLIELANDESAPIEVRVAAQFFVSNGEVWTQVPSYPTWEATSQDLRNFVAANAALAQMARSYDRWDTANEGDPDEADGHVSTDDLLAVVNDTTGRYTDDERWAAQTLLDLPHTYVVWEDRQALTYSLFSRRVFTEDPELAVEYLRQAQEDPHAFVADYTWFDGDGGRAWMDAAVSSTTDPARQAELLLAFAAVYQATMPEPIGLLDIVHGLLDAISFVDPFQVADAVNAGIYVLEGDAVNAGIAAAGILIPLGGGGLIRMSKEGLLSLASRRGDEFAESVLRQAIRSGEFTDDMVEQAVKDITDEFGDDAGRQLREYLDDLAGAEHLDDVGPGAWTAKNESMSDRAAEFQSEVTGAPPGTVYRSNGVDFDGYSNGVLLDAKGPGYATFVNADGTFKPWFRGADEFLDDAERQLAAANGQPIRWVVAEPATADAIRQLFAREGIRGIDVVG